MVDLTKAEPGDLVTNQVYGKGEVTEVEWNAVAIQWANGQVVWVFDKETCTVCGAFGDTVDHLHLSALLPRKR